MKIIKTEKKTLDQWKSVFQWCKYKTFAFSLFNYGLIIDNKLKISVYKLI